MYHNELLNKIKVLITKELGQELSTVDPNPKNYKKLPQNIGHQAPTILETAQALMECFRESTDYADIDVFGNYWLICHYLEHWHETGGLGDKLSANQRYDEAVRYLLTVVRDETFDWVVGKLRDCEARQEPEGLANDP